MSGRVRVSRVGIVAGIRMVRIVKQALRGCRIAEGRGIAVDDLGGAVGGTGIGHVVGGDGPVIGGYFFFRSREVADVGDAEPPESILARNDDVWKGRDNARAGSIANDPQRFILNDGRTAENFGAAGVRHTGDQQSDGRRRGGRVGRQLLLRLRQRDDEERRKKIPWGDFNREHD